MRKEIEQLEEVIKLNTHGIEKLPFVFFGYFSLYTIQSSLLNDGISMNEMYKLLEKNDSDKNHIIPQSSNFINGIKATFIVYKTYYGEETSDRIEHNWRNFGFNAIEEEFRINPNGLQIVINKFNDLKNLTIDDLLDLAEYLNVSNRNLNNFFTPTNISTCASTIVSTPNQRVLTKKGEINIYDPTCGIGRMLYHSYLDIREKFPNKRINIFGIDIYERFGVITSSILNLVNKETYVVVGDTLTIDPQFPKMDIITGNPPFGNICDNSYKNILLLREYSNRNNIYRDDKNYKNLLKEMKKFKLKPLSQYKYKAILDDYKVI